MMFVESPPAMHPPIHPSTRAHIAHKQFVFNSFFYLSSENLFIYIVRFRQKETEEERRLALCMCRKVAQHKNLSKRQKFCEIIQNIYKHIQFFFWNCMAQRIIIMKTHYTQERVCVFARVGKKFAVFCSICLSLCVCLRHSYLFSSDTRNFN